LIHIDEHRWSFTATGPTVSGWARPRKHGGPRICQPQTMSVATAPPEAEAAGARMPEDLVIVLLGATGDLARRKLIPCIFHLAQAGLMPQRFQIVGAARSQHDDEEFRELAHASLDGLGRRPPDPRSWARFSESLRYATVGDGFEPLADAVAAARGELGPDAKLLLYLSLPPRVAEGTVDALKDVGLGPGARVITEKPFGTDLESARSLNAKLGSVFAEHCIYRIDHYLGREAVQNLLAMRFANGMFEPIWNRNHIDHIQIDVPETLSIEMRGSFYDETGAFRDMVVTHLFQVLGFVAMEPPTSLEPRTLSLEREKVFDSMPPLEPANAVRGQYVGYRDEAGVAPDSDTETFVALEAFVDNWRWEGVPFYLRSGKRLAQSRHLLTIAFKEPPRRMFPLDCDQVEEDFGRDHLSFELGDPGSISATFLAKVPGPTFQLGEAHMRFSYAESLGGPEQALDPYERLIHDVIRGDRTLFTGSAAIERLWEISEPLLAAGPRSIPYEVDSWGPEEQRALIAPRRWHLPNTHG
jgi:glucose-6-phosphate 1-dehydrogenase